MVLRSGLQQAALGRLVVAPLCSWALVVFAATALAQGVPTFSSQIDVVKLDVSVTRGSRSVEGLSAADFEVLDNGVRQEVELLGSEETALETMLLLDTSQSVAGRRLTELKTAVTRFVEGLGSEDHASLITFARQIRQRAESGSDRAALLAAVDQVEAGGTTSLCDAVLLGLVRLQPGERRPVLVVFSDGADFMSWLTPEEVGAVARRSEAVVYVVSAADKPAADRRIVQANLWPTYAFAPPPVPRTWLENLALASGGAVFWSRESQLTEAFLAVLRALKTRYVLRYEPTGVASEGWHTLKVRAPRTRGAVRTREGYFARR
jgi:VWFA-related protein